MRDMQLFRKLDPFVQSAVGWITLGGLALSAFYSVVALLSPLFAERHWTEIVLLSIAMSLATLLAIAIMAALIAWAVRKIKPLPVGSDGAALYDELERTKERLKRAEERLDGAKVASAAIHASASGKGETQTLQVPLVDNTASGKRGLRLSRAEQDRVTDRLIKLDDYITGELAEIVGPLRDLMNWKEDLRHSSAGELHRRIENMRQPLAQHTREVGQALTSFQADTDVLDLNPMAIKTKLIPVNDALGDFTNVSQFVAEDSIHFAPFIMPGRQMNAAIGALSDEIERVRRDIANWRKRIAQGELD